MFASTRTGLRLWTGALHIRASPAETRTLFGKHANNRVCHGAPARNPAQLASLAIDPTLQRRHRTLVPSPSPASRKRPSDDGWVFHTVQQCEGFANAPGRRFRHLFRRCRIRFRVISVALFSNPPRSASRRAAIASCLWRVAQAGGGLLRQIAAQQRARLFDLSPGCPGRGRLSRQAPKRQAEVPQHEDSRYANEPERDWYERAGPVADGGAINVSSGKIWSSKLRPDSW